MNTLGKKGTVKVLKTTEEYDIVKITTEEVLNYLTVVSGEIIARTEHSVTVKLKQDGAIMLWKHYMIMWNRKEKMFVIQ